MDELTHSSPLTMPSGAPPPPAEVKIRTLQSDLDSMAKSGGGMPRFENVEVPGLMGGGMPDAEVKKSHLVVAAVGTVVALALVGAAGYIAYTKLATSASSTPSSSEISVPSSQAASNTSLPANMVTSPSATLTPSSSAGGAGLSHRSLFYRAADQTFTMTFADKGGVQSASDLQTYGQKLEAALAGASAGSSFFEVAANYAGGGALDVGSLLGEANALVLDPSVFAADFNPDATLFVYRDKNGFWPGYVLALKNGVSLAAAQADAQKLESSALIQNFFLANVGTADTAGFSDATVNTMSVRELAFTGNIPTHFVYGWDKTYLIMSTSESGFTQAVAHLP